MITFCLFCFLKMFKTNCFDIWQKEQDSCKVITLCKDLDTQLGGGIPLRIITELCGAPGSGKTQMCLQLSINVQLPKEVGGLGGQALYVDTNQGFNPERLNEMSICMQERFQNTFSQMDSNELGTNTLSSAQMLENVSYVYCSDYVELLATVEYMKVLASQMPELRLIIIDSFSFCLRSIDDVSIRTRINYDILRDLQQLAIEFEIALVITNELTTRILDSDSKICPALGESHTHKIHQRILLSKNHETNLHVAFVEKSLLSPKVGVPFIIKKSGLRGISC